MMKFVIVGTILLVCLSFERVQALECPTCFSIHSNLTTITSPLGSCEGNLTKYSACNENQTTCAYLSTHGSGQIPSQISTDGMVTVAFNATVRGCISKSIGDGCRKDDDARSELESSISNHLEDAGITEQQWSLISPFVLSREEKIVGEVCSDIWESPDGAAAATHRIGITIILGLSVIAILANNY